MSTLYPTTLDNYSQEAFRLLAFVIRAAAGHLPELPEVIVNDEQVKIVREVVEALSVEQETPRTRPALIPSQWDQLIQRFVMSLFRQKCLPNQHTRWFSPVICFAALDSVTSGGDFKHAYQITQTFAKLVYLGRSAIIVECKEVEKAQSLDAHELRHSSPYVASRTDILTSARSTLWWNGTFGAAGLRPSPI